MNNIDFFAPLEKFSSVDIDWWDTSSVWNKFQLDKTILSAIPNELLENKKFFFSLQHRFEPQQIYHLFRDNVQNDYDVLHNVFNNFVDNEQIYLLPLNILNDVDWMIKALIIDPKAYRYIGKNLKNNVDFNIQMVKNLLKNTPFKSINPIIFESIDFLFTLSTLCQNNKIEFHRLSDLFPQELIFLLLAEPSQDREDFFHTTILKRKLDTNLVKTLKEEKISKIKI